MKATLEKQAYGGWPNCLRLSDGKTELVVTTDVGPRVIRLARVGGPNLFKEFDEQMGRTGDRAWNIYGGHRFWIAPELKALTYVTDNVPVPWTWNGRELRLTQRPDRPSGLQKEMRIRLENGAVRVEHVLTHRGRKAVTVAPWSLSVMAPGGVAILPQEAYGCHTENLLPARPLVMWKYTNMADPRWTWGERYVQLRQDVRNTRPQKAGFGSTPAWMAYALPHATFVKRHTFDPKATYADMGCNAEIFTNENFLELESLGALVSLKPGAKARHVETWRVFPSVVKDFSEKALDRTLRPLLAGTPAAR